MLRWPLALALLLAMPAAAAFPTAQEDLLIAYEVDATPVIIATGEVGLQGALTGGLFVGGLERATLRDIGQLILIERGEEGNSRSDLAGATLQVEQGGLLWTFENGSLDLDLQAPYGVGLALPEAPLPAPAGEAPPAGFLLAGESLGGTARWAGASVTLVPLDAVVTVRDASGQPLPDWNGRRVNRDAKSLSDTQDGGGLEAVFRAERGFSAELQGQILAGATGARADLVLAVSHADVDRFAQTVELLGAAAASFAGEDGSGFGGGESPLAALEQASDLLNGALLLVPGGGPAGAATPVESRWGDEDFAVGQFNMMRGDGMQVRWEDGEMRVAGEPTVALGREGFAVEPPLAVGVFPLVSLGLWALALGAVVLYFVKRPPKGNPQFPVRLLSIGIWLVALLAALYLWDRSFTQTFGTGALRIALEEGVNPDTLPRIGIVAALELVPWSIAALFFAFPVRIALGIALRYLGKGKSYKGIATAGGLVSLAVLGPIYALWCFNVVWAQAGRMMPSP